MPLKSALYEPCRAYYAAEGGSKGAQLRAERAEATAGPAAAEGVIGGDSGACSCLAVDTATEKPAGMGSQVALYRFCGVLPVSVISNGCAQCSCTVCCLPTASCFIRRHAAVQPQGFMVRFLAGVGSSVERSQALKDQSHCSDTTQASTCPPQQLNATPSFSLSHSLLQMHIA